MSLKRALSTPGILDREMSADRNTHFFTGIMIHEPRKAYIRSVDRNDAPEESSPILTNASVGGSAKDEEPKTWTLLSNHAHVLVCLAQDPTARLRDIAQAVGITERGVFRVVTELEHGGIVRRIREGRRNRYELDLSAHLRHPLEAECTVGDLLALLLRPNDAKALGLKPRRAPVQG